MADNVVDKLLIEIGFDTNAIKKSSRDLEDIVSGAMRNITAAIATVFSVGALKDLVTGFAKAGSELHFLSQKTGESVVTLNAWQQGVKRFGGTAESFTATLNGVRNAIQDVAVTGGSGVGGFLAAIGVKARDANGKLKSTTEVLKDIGTSMRGMDVNKAQYVQRQLGIDDATFRMITQGRQQLDSYIATMAKQSTMNDRMAERALKLKQNLDNLSQSWDNLKFAMGEKLAPVAIKLINIFIKLTNEYLPKIKQGWDEVSKKFGISADTISKIIVVLTSLLAFGVALKGFGLILSTISGGFGLITTGIAAALSPLGALIASMLILYEVYKKINAVNPDAKKEMSLNMRDATKSGAISGGWNPNLGDAWNLLKSGHPIDAFKKMRQPWGQSPNNMSSEMQAIWNSLSPHEKAQLMKESGGKNTVGDNGRSFGLFQIQPGTAKEAWGREVSGQELMNPRFNLETYRRLQAKYLASAGGNQMAADAYYNGGLGGFNHFLRTGKSYNGYAETISQNTPLYASGAKHSTTSNSNSSTVNINGNISLPNVKNGSDFVSQFKDYSNPMNITRSVNNFQSGKVS